MTITGGIQFVNQSSDTLWYLNLTIPPVLKFEEQLAMTSISNSRQNCHLLSIIQDADWY